MFVEIVMNTHIHTHISLSKNYDGGDGGGHDDDDDGKYSSYSSSWKLLFTTCEDDQKTPTNQNTDWWTLILTDTSPTPKAPKSLLRRAMKIVRARARGSGTLLRDPAP